LIKNINPLLKSILKHIAATALIGALTACAMPQRVGSSPAAVEQAHDQEVYTDLIRGMLAQGQYYAALAHIQEQQSKDGRSDELTYLEAEARRKLGQSAPAEKLYDSLLHGEYAGQAEHGLGLLYADQDLNRSIGHLRAAVQRRPTDAEARNDLGYALMMAGRYGEALPEIATAVELEPAGDKARNNLIILLFASGDDAGARRVATQSQVPAATLARLHQQAQSLSSRTAAKRGGR
jgi:Flp pilus assembly protein TadD